MPDSVKKPEILDSRLLSAEEIGARGFALEEMLLRFSNGVERRFRRIRPGGRQVVMIVPVIDPGTVLLIREYSAGVHEYQLQLPKGAVEPGEDLLEAANRELKEEAGKGARRLERINSLTALPGFMAQRTEVILAEDLYDERLPGDEPEQIEVVPWPLAELHTLAGRADCTEARSIAALYYVRDLLAARTGGS